MIGADAIVKCLEAEGVEMVYGYPGVAICPFYNSILNTDIRTVLIRTEQNAAHAASGYARISGKPGVCCVTSGPGATNLITGIATAFADSIPLICITGQVDTQLIGSDVFQEADITGAVESFVKYSYLIRDVNDIPRVFKEAFHIASTGRKGPVLIDIPADVQKDTISKFKYPEEVSMRTYKPTVKGNMVQIKKVAKQLSGAKRPIICAGGGVLLAGAQEKLQAFSEKFGIPVVSTMMGIGVMPTDHPFYYGMVGNNGRAYANRAMNESDFLMFIGARVADRAVSQNGFDADNKTLVHIDVDPAEIGKNVGATIPIVGDVACILEDLLNQDITVESKKWQDTLKEYRKAFAEYKESHADALVKKSGDAVDPCEFVEVLSRALDDNAVYVADVGQNQIWSCGNYVMKKGRFLTSGGMGTMGYSIPAAMGAKMADPSRQVVAVCGDGAFQMSMMELATIMQEKVDVKIFVMNNEVLGMVREHQHFVYKDKFSMIDLSQGSPDLGKLSEAYGIHYKKITSEKNMKKEIEAFLKKKGCGLMECRILPDEVVRGM
ncbi:MAG: biosynthetic-type acetolactate synthase large subunit [Lachnospiraceae bacterium]|nr:biosynthetic-type acetolactate synthase large subunit [Lachnospiraceae bacterium]